MMMKQKIKNKKLLINEKEVDFQDIKSHLFRIEFNAKEDFPVLLKPFQFKRFGFKNKNDCKLLCKKTKLLVKKYPKEKNQRKKQVEKNSMIKKMKHL